MMMTKTVLLVDGGQDDDWEYQLVTTISLITCDKHFHNRRVGDDDDAVGDDDDAVVGDDGRRRWWWC